MLPKNKYMPRVAVMASAAMIILLASCQGRTSSNMVPNGETIEVEIAKPASVDSDSSADNQIQSDSIQTDHT